MGRLSKAANGSWRRILGLQEAAVLVTVLAVVFISMSILSDDFLTADSFLAASRSMSEIALVGIGMTVVLLTGGIDLSVGSNMALATVVIGIMCHANVAPWLACAIGMAVAMLCGALNGVLITRLRMPPIIVTIGTFALFRGTAMGLSGGEAYQIPPALYPIGQGSVGPIPISIIIALIIAVLVGFLLIRTRIGRYLSAMGYNENAAVASGVPVASTKLGIYLFSGAMSGLAAAIFVSRVASARASAGLGMELDAITVAVLGGASLTGGRGSVAGTILGVVILGLLRDGLTLDYIDPDLQNVAFGALLIFAVAVSRLIGHPRYRS
jgi:rhamnose transport system permease protein